MAENVRRDRHRAPSKARRRDLARIRPGSVPGSLPPPEPGAPAPTRVHVLAFTRDAVTETDGKTVDEALATAGPGVRWINIDAPDATLLREIGLRFKLHPLALEDVLSVPQRPKVERYAEHYFMVLRMLRCLKPAEAEVDQEQISIFFGREWVITLQERADGDVFDPVRDAIRQSRGRVRDAGADYLAYLLLDASVDALFPVLEVVSDGVEAIESEALHPGPGTLSSLQHTRHTVTALRRSIWPTREAIAVLQREENPLIQPETRVFLRDTHDHAVQSLELVESLREMLADVMDIYLSSQNQRLNEVMKVLTVIATLFIPLTFIASIYGMNFENIPELKWRFGYVWALGLMAASATVMLLFFRRKGWW
jgi:magnesium transporter